MADPALRRAQRLPCALLAARGSLAVEDRGRRVAQRHLAAPPIVATALCARRAGDEADLDPASVTAFAAQARAEVEDRLAGWDA